MKIAYCLKSYFNSGGMERIVIDKVNALANKGYKMTLITTDQKNRSSFFPVSKNVKCIDLNINYDEIEALPFLKKLFKRAIKIKQHKRILNQLCQSEKFDIIISTFGNEINFLHTIDDVKKKIAEIHFNKNYRLLFSQSKFRKLVNKYLTRSYERLANKLDAFVCLTEEDRTEWKNVKNVVAIPNFIEKKADTPAELSKKKVIAVGRLSFQKGYDLMLKCWRIVIEQYPDWTLHIYGGGELKGNIEDLRQKYGLINSVEIHPPVKNIYSKLTDSSIYCMTSRFEGLPMVLLEAMGCGLPIVSFDCKCGPKDLLENNNAGILVQYGNIDLMAKELCRLISDSQLRKEIGAESYHEADKYLIGNIIPKWENLFKKLLENP